MLISEVADFRNTELFVNKSVIFQYILTSYSAKLGFFYGYNLSPPLEVS